MFGRNGKLDVEADIHKDQKRKKIILAVVFGVFFLIVINLVMYMLTRI